MHFKYIFKIILREIFLLLLGIKLKSKLSVIRVEPFDGPITVRIDDSETEYSLGRKVAEEIWVSVPDRVKTKKEASS